MRAPAPSLRPIDRRADLEREVHQLVDLLGEHLAERAAEHGEVLAEHEHLAAVDRAPAGDHAVGVGPLLEAGVVGAVAGQQVELVEAAVVEQVLDPLAGEHLALRVLALDRPLGTGVNAASRRAREVGDPVLHRPHGPDTTRTHDRRPRIARQPDLSPERVSRCSHELQSRCEEPC